MGRWRGLLLGLGLPILAFVGPVQADGEGSRAPARHIVIIAAAIEEVPPLTWQHEARDVAFSIELAGRPDCSQAKLLRYGFLLALQPERMAEATQSASTADSVIVAQCRGGRLVASNATVQVNAAEDEGYEVRITVAIEQLPAMEFGWAAFASDGATMVRVPEYPKWAGWAVWDRRFFE